MTKRLILDVSSLLHWQGPPSGVARVEYALATAALGRSDAVVACYNPMVTGPCQLRALSPAYRDIILGWSGVLDTDQPPPERATQHRFLPSGRPIVKLLERLRLTTRLRPFAWSLDMAQRVIVRALAQTEMLYGAGDGRFATVPRDLGLAEAITPGPGDTVLSAGFGWNSGGVSCIASARSMGARTAVLCYDLIPATHPHLYPPDIVDRFETYWCRTFPLLDRVIVTADCIANDVREFCRLRGLPTPELVRLPLGYDPPDPPLARSALPEGLQPGNYALLVSTIEPRKGHAMLLRAWRRLCDQGLPQQTGFRLVFVGRRGWMAENVMTDLADTAGHGGTALHLRHVGEAMLEQIYQGAAFCLYPSVYEGFGLPIIEAFARGKPVLASTGGAVAETAGALAPQLDPLDDAAWADAIGTWITDPAARGVYASRISTGFSHPSWPVAAAGILDAAAPPRDAAARA